jgi:hypothetical protein
MTTTVWEGPNANQKLRTDLERAALALAKARHQATGAPVIISLELEYFGFNTYNDPSMYRQGEYHLFVRLTDETRPRRIRKGDGRGKQNGGNPPIRSGKQHSKPSKPFPAVLQRAGSNIPQGWIVAPPGKPSESRASG